jgi:hypothetical protein
MHSNRIKLEQLDVFALMASALAPPTRSEWPSERQQHVPEPAAAENAPARRGLLERLDHWFWRHEQRAMEAHLAKSTDIYDLEKRIRDLERGTPRLHY